MGGGLQGSKTDADRTAPLDVDDVATSLWETVFFNDFILRFLFFFVGVVVVFVVVPPRPPRTTRGGPIKSRQNSAKLGKTR